jgi:hypothetical protein
MARGRNEPEWLRAKCLAEAIRGCWVKERLPEAAMNPYHRKNSGITPGMKLRLFMESLRAKHGAQRQ